VTAQRVLIGLAILAGLVSGSVYYLGAQRMSVVVAAQDLAPGRPISAEDVEIRSLPPDALPPGVLAERSEAVGRYPKAPVWRGQLVLADAIAWTHAEFDSGIVPPTGYRAVAIPVNAAQALGGAVAPGARVDVVAVPMPGRAPDGQSAELLVTAALVIDVRGEQGGPFERPSPRDRTVIARERLGSVVIAVGPSQELLVAARIATSSFVLVLVPERP
jgi:Flp pilus assembly protein CpaB